LKWVVNYLCFLYLLETVCFAIGAARRRPDILDWQQQQSKAEVPFSQRESFSRTSLESQRVVSAMVDLAAMRDAVVPKHGVDPSLVNPKCPTDLIVFLFESYFHSAIQNAPNPGGGTVQTRARVLLVPHPPAFRPEGAHTVEQRGHQIENTPLPAFHLKPVSELW
uniref:Uncharacterized protein n=1 Tax=Seriola dumerili TaxID=41447 RepID=A0A3B4VQ50_SERDU